MSVRVLLNSTGQQFTGKYVFIAHGQVNLYAGRWMDDKGVWRRSSRRQVFPADAVTVAADMPEIEIEIKEQDYRTSGTDLFPRQ